MGILAMLSLVWAAVQTFAGGYLISHVISCINGCIKTEAGRAAYFKSIFLFTDDYKLVPKEDGNINVPEYRWLAWMGIANVLAGLISIGLWILVYCKKFDDKFLLITGYMLLAFAVVCETFVVVPLLQQAQQSLDSTLLMWVLPGLGNIALAIWTILLAKRSCCRPEKDEPYELVDVKVVPLPEPEV